MFTHHNSGKIRGNISILSQRNEEMLEMTVNYRHNLYMMEGD